MTFVGKVLIVVQFVLSLCFMAFAAAVFTVQTNWKTEAEKRGATIEAMRTEQQNLTADFTSLKDRSAALVGAAPDQFPVLQQQGGPLLPRAEKAEADVARLNDENKKLTDELARAKTELTEQQALATIAGEEAKMRRDQAVTMSVINRNLHESRDTLTAKVAELEDRLFAEQRDNKLNSGKYRKLLEDYALTQSYLRLKGLEVNPAELAGQQPPPVVEGLVVDSRTGTGAGRGTEYVEISIGSDDGLAKGHNLFVYRGADGIGARGKYLGQIKVVYVTPDKAVGEVVQRAKNGVIQKGDNVTTKL